MRATIARDSLVALCPAVMKLYGIGYLRKPAYTNIEKLYVFHEQKHEFPRMIGRIDCMNWSWGNFPNALKAQFSSDDHGPDPLILSEPIASQDLRIWHAFFGVVESNNDMKVIQQSPLFNDLKSGRLTT
ncbi:ALP1-like protein [Tanacetum coccineum]